MAVSSVFSRSSSSWIAAGTQAPPTKLAFTCASPRNFANTDDWLAMNWPCGALTWPSSSSCEPAPQVLTPITRPQASISGPPELPGLIGAVWKMVSMRPPPGAIDENSAIDPDVTYGSCGRKISVSDILRTSSVTPG